MTATRALLVVLAALAPLNLVAQQESAAAGRFATVDVYIDSAEPLAAWQFEPVERRGAMQVVGIEGGDAATFDAPPFYDRPPSTAERRIASSSPTSA